MTTRKITVEQEKEICDEYDKGIKLKIIANKFNVSYQTVKTHLLRHKNMSTLQQKLTNKQIKTMIKEYDNGDSTLKLSQKYGKCSETIRKIILKSKHTKIIGRRSRIPIKIINKITKMYKNGEKISEIERICGVERSSIVDWARKFNIPIRPFSISKYKCRFDFFSKITTHEQAYWLGVLYADSGIIVNILKHIHRMAYDVATKDVTHLKRFLHSLKSNCPIRTRIVKLKDGKFHNVKSVIINSKQMVSDLIRNGCGPRKSFTIRLPLLPKHLILSFVLGYSDGDGCFSINKPKNKVFNNFSIASNKKFCKDIQILFTKHGISGGGVYYHKPKKIGHKGIYYLQYGGIFQLYHIIRLIYQNSNVIPYLPRKKRKADLIIKRALLKYHTRNINAEI
jgi:Mor family transcriptional regulator